MPRYKTDVQGLTPIDSKVCPCNLCTVIANDDRNGVNVDVV